MRRLLVGWVAAWGLVACGDEGPPGASTVTTEHCTYVPLVPTSGAGGTVTAGALEAGAAERVLHVPVGTALGGYTGRAGVLGSAATVDTRDIELAGSFHPSIGVTSAPRVKVLALSAGGETVLVVKLDAIFVYEGMVFDVEQRLGPAYAGKVLLAASHSHSAWAQFTGHGPLKLGAGPQRALVYDRFITAIEGAARDALAARRPAKLGVHASRDFDPADQITRDRRRQNDALPGGDRKDVHLFVIRVDATDGTPIAVVPVFGEHGTLNGEDNPFASTEGTGAIERLMQEQFDTPVVVMHLQGAGADTSPAAHGSVDCANKPGKDSDPCFEWATEEGHARVALGELMGAWNLAGAAMQTQLALEMVSRSIETGPSPATFAIRGGALSYATWDGVTMPDRVVHDGAALATPIDEFNAPVGAALCASAEPMFPTAAIAGTEGVLPYGSCLRLDVAGELLGGIFEIDFGVDETHPVCETTRTTISALRLGDYLVGTLPGEVSVLLADLVRERSPVAADKTIVVGYAQGHVGYMLRPEDWVLGGYEPSVTFWGPLEAEHIAEQLLALAPLALTAEREDAASGGTTRVAAAAVVDALELDDPAPGAGTIPEVVPDVTWARTGAPTAAQPAAQIPRVSGIATFVWIGDDPQVQTPRVTLEHEISPGVFAPVIRRSGRSVDDGEIVLAYTPSPLQRSGPQTHVWVAEWQAVPWLGAGSVDSLDARGGVPLGRYRFTVAGDGWTLASDAFEVVAGGVAITDVTRGPDIRARVTWHADQGWRLMDLALPSNQPVPVRNQPVTVALLGPGGTVLSSVVATTDGEGFVQVPDDGTAVSARVTDRFGNVGSVALPPAGRRDVRRSPRGLAVTP